MIHSHCLAELSGWWKLTILLASLTVLLLAPLLLVNLGASARFAGVELRMVSEEVLRSVSRGPLMLNLSISVGCCDWCTFRVRRGLYFLRRSGRVSAPGSATSTY